MSDTYTRFLAEKRVTVEPSGFRVDEADLNPLLFAFQKAIVIWALLLGRAALFLGVGLGKTFIQLEWARHVARHTGRPVLIVVPLAVAAQTIREGAKFGIEVFHVHDIDEFLAIAGGSFAPRLFVTNYERIHLFDLSLFGGIVLDESSILKHYSVTFFDLVGRCADIPYRLCCTATPAPNDFVEFGNHAMFLGIMHFKDMLARWFTGEGDVARHARLKHYARADFWQAVKAGQARCTYTQSSWYEPTGTDTTYTVVGLERCDFCPSLLHAETDPPTNDLYLMEGDEVKVFEVTP